MSWIDRFKGALSSRPAAAKADGPSVSLPMYSSDSRLAEAFRRGWSLDRWEAEAGDPWLSVPVATCLRWITANYPLAWLALYTEGKGPGDPDTPDYDAPIVRAVGRTRGMSLTERWSLSIVSHLCWGETYWIKVRTMGDEIVRYQWVPPKTCGNSTRWGMEPIGSRTEEIRKFRYWVDGGYTDYEPEQIIYTRQAPNPDDPKRGMAFLRAGLRNIVGAERADTLAADLLGRTTTSKVFIPDQGYMLDEAQEDGVRSGYEHSVNLRSSRLPIMRVAGRFEDVGRPPADMGLDFLPGQFVSAVCALIGLDPLVVGMGGIARGTFENQEQARRAGWESCLAPIQDAFADSITAASREDFGLADNQYIGWDRTHVPALKDDRSQQIADAGTLFEKRLYPRDMALSTCGLEPVGPELGGDLYADGTDGSSKPESNPESDPNPNAPDPNAPDPNAADDDDPAQPDAENTDETG